MGRDGQSGGAEDRTRSTGKGHKEARVLAFPTPRSGHPRPHLCGYGLPGARGLLPSALEVGAVSWTLGLRPGAISGALAGLGLAIPTFCGRLLGWPGAERPRKETTSDWTGPPV